MADQNKRAGKPKRSGRTAGLAGLAAIIAVVAMWLSDCIPGFGIGSGTQEGEAEQTEDVEPAKPAEPEPEPPEPTEPEQPATRKPMPMKLTVDARGCTVDGSEFFECKTLCEREELFDDVDSVIIDAKDGPHGAVVEVLDCLKSKNLKAAIARE